MLTVFYDHGTRISLLKLVQSDPKPHAEHRIMTNVAPLHGGINILLGGVMMGGMLVMVFCICYCCHKRVQKTQFPENGSDNWINSTEDSDSNMAVFTLDGANTTGFQQCYEVEGVFVDSPTPQPSPPPSYHDVILEEKMGKEKNDSELPSYEEAVRLEQMHRLSINRDFGAMYMDQLTYI